MEPRRRVEGAAVPGEEKALSIADQIHQPRGEIVEPVSSHSRRPVRLLAGREPPDRTIPDRETKALIHHRILRSRELVLVRKEQMIFSRRARACDQQDCVR
ncbi:MAG: hypothetical protein ACRD21_06690 [Vicinamibacteria bacterium]